MTVEEEDALEKQINEIRERIKRGESGIHQRSSRGDNKGSYIDDSINQDDQVPGFDVDISGHFKS